MKNKNIKYINLVHIIINQKNYTLEIENNDLYIIRKYKEN